MARKRSAVFILNVEVCIEDRIVRLEGTLEVFPCNSLPQAGGLCLHLFLSTSSSLGIPTDLLHPAKSVSNQSM